MSLVNPKGKAFLNSIDISGMIISANATVESWQSYAEITLKIIGQVREKDGDIYITTPAPLQQAPCEAEELERSAQYYQDHKDDPDDDEWGEAEQAPSASRRSR